MSTRNSQELPPPGCHQQGRAHPTSERQVSGRGRRRQPQEGPKPGSPGSRLLLPLGPTRPHTVSAQSTPLVQPVLRRQAPLPPRWPQCRRGAGWPGSTNGHRRPPALPRPPLPTLGPLPVAPPPPAQARVGSGPSAIHSLEGGPGQALTRGRARQGSGEPGPALSLFRSPWLQAGRLSGQRPQQRTLGQPAHSLAGEKGDRARGRVAGALVRTGSGQPLGLLAWPRPPCSEPALGRPGLRSPLSRLHIHLAPRPPLASPPK